MRRAVPGGDRGDRQARPGRHQAREFQTGVAGGEKLEQFVLQVENFQPLVAIGDLENEARAGIVAQEEILVALAGQRFGGERQSIEVVGQADGVAAGELRGVGDVHGTISTAAERSLSLPALSKALTA